jgi:hypothetical protein
MTNGGTDGSSMAERILGDPLSDVTRKQRTYLLGIGAAGIVMVHVGLVPSRISALGITFKQPDQKTLIFLIGLVVAYFLVAFVLYAVTDFLKANAARREAYAEALRNNQNDPTLPGRRTFSLASARLAFECALPIVLGMYAVILLFARALSL